MRRNNNTEELNQRKRIQTDFKTSERKNIIIIIITIIIIIFFFFFFLLIEWTSAYRALLALQLVLAS